MSSNNYIIKEGASGAFFVKKGNTSYGGFMKKEHAELFLSALKGDLQKEAWQRGVDDVGLLIDGQDIHLTGELINPYKNL